MINNLIALYLLQVSATDFNIDSGTSERGAIYFGIVVVIVIVALTIITLVKRSKGGGGGTRSKLFSRFALHRLAKAAGLNHEQIKMLDFVFKTDNVMDYEKSLANQSLLDLHFKRAHRVIETTNSNQEIVRKHAVLFSTRNILENSSIGAISSSRQLKEDTKLIINNGRDKLNVKILSIKTENLVVETPKNVLGSYIRITKGTNLNIMFFTRDDKCFSFETYIIDYTNYHGREAILLAHSNQIRLLSQRRYRRRQTAIDCFLCLVYTEGSGKKQRMIVDKRRFSGNIVDISVGGCSIKTTTPVKAGVRFKIEFTMEGNNLAALGQVSRTNKAGIKMIAHIKFLKVTQKTMNLINAFVYEYSNE
jgi:c-di-GMP-binding flagellar brake protein YcgR